MIKSLADIAPIAAYLERIGAEVRSLRSAIVKEQAGRYWRDTAVIAFEPDGAVVAPEEYKPTSKELKAIRKAFKKARFPRHKPWPIDKPLPDEVSTADREGRLFRFLTPDGQKVIMAQVRAREGDDGAKYLPFTPFSDGVWRWCEPEGLLPVWGLDGIGDNTTAFLHEGAKSASHVRELISDPDRCTAHPFGRELSGAAHLGWIGGALNPHRTDWSVLRRSGLRQVYIVPDNDVEGREGVPAIARELDKVCWSLEFTREFPPGFDLADEFPESMFQTIEGAKYYNGPAFKYMKQPATWMTRKGEAEGRGRPPIYLSKAARGLWTYVEEIDQFVCSQMPQFMRTRTVLNNMLRPYSDVQDTADRILKEQRGRTVGIAYRPDMPPGEHKLTDGERSAMNVHVPPEIRAIEGDTAIWDEYLDYLVTDLRDRKELKRWCATLIARPDIRMGYGVLMVSEMQGVGKTLLGEFVLAPLLGPANVSFPGETAILSEYNDWSSYVRLAVIQEIYQGHSWRSYNALKSLITDKTIHVNKKYVPAHSLENWMHIYACSNSRQALKIEEKDRRWLCPRVTEVPWPEEKFRELRNWLNAGGLGIVKWWAENYGDYVAPWKHAPRSKTKDEMILDSMTEGQQLAARLAFQMSEVKRPLSADMNEVDSWVRSRVKGRHFSTSHDLKRSMIAAGLSGSKTRIRSNGIQSFFVVNKAGLKAVSNPGKKEGVAGTYRRIKINPAAFWQESL